MKFIVNKNVILFFLINALEAILRISFVRH